MVKKSSAKFFTHDGSAPCGKILCAERKAEARDAEDDHEYPAAYDVRAVVIRDARVDYARDDKRNKKLKSGLRHLEQRSQDRIS